MSLQQVLLLVILAAPPPTTVRQTLESHAADSLFVPLARIEAARRGDESAQAALEQGRLHYARGEYRQAAVDFSRAGPRSDPARRAEASYWTGLSLLGAAEPGQARGAFQAAARGGPGLRPQALLGVAQCEEATHHPERALGTLQTLLAGDPGEAGPAALERVAALAAHLGRPELARRARARLVKDYPRSIEAARAPAGLTAAAAPRLATGRPPAAPRVAPPPLAAQAPLAVQVGIFREQARALELAERVRRGGFGPARVVALSEAGVALFAVRVGIYATAEDARGAGDRLGRALGLSWRLVPVP